MSEVCTDNRFELIKKYKDKLLEGTNIENSKEEMKVINNILFRFWQMGWLDVLEKQIPKKPIKMVTGQMDGNWMRICPNCKVKLVERITTTEISWPHIYNTSNYCIKCGQRLDWE